MLNLRIPSLTLAALLCFGSVAMAQDDNWPDMTNGNATSADGKWKCDTGTGKCVPQGNMLELLASKLAGSKQLAGARWACDGQSGDCQAVVKLNIYERLAVSFPGGSFSGRNSSAQSLPSTERSCKMPRHKHWRYR